MVDSTPPTALHSTRRQLVLFIAIGGINTLFYLGVFNGLRLTLDAYAANALAVTMSILFSFWANRRFTFQFSGAERGSRQLALFALIFLVTLGVSSGALAILFAVVDDPSVLQENIFLVGSSGALVLVRFELIRRWVFNPVDKVTGRRSSPTRSPEAR